MSVERVGILVEVQGADEALAKLKELQKVVTSLKRSGKINLGDKSMNALTSATKSATKGVEELGNKLGTTTQKVITFGEAWRKSSKTWGATIKQIGSGMQTINKTIGKLTSPLSRLMRGTVFAAGYKMLNLFTSGLTGAAERYDTLQTYNKSMSALGLDASQTFKVSKNQKEELTAIQNLNDAVLGLPTGLDEIVAAQKVYAGSTGEMVKSTKLAIAANNTFLASQMGSREQRFMQKYLTAMASGSELASNQWASMFRIAPLAMRAVSEQLGYAEDEFDDFRKAATSGTIATDKFLNAFIKVGTEGRVQAAANVMKTTFEGLTANIQNAARRLGENLLLTLDNVFTDYNGRNLIQNLLGVDAEGNEIGDGLKHWIDDLSKTIADFVRANPDMILDFVNTLKSFDWQGLTVGLLEGLKANLEVIMNIAQWLGKNFGKDGARFYARLLWYNKIIGLAGGFLRGLSPLLGRLVGFFAVLGGNKVKDGLFGKLVTLFTGKKAAETIAQAKVIPTFGETMRGIFDSLSGVIKVAGTIGIAVGTGVLTLKGFKTMIKDLGDIVYQSKLIDWYDGATALSGMAAFLAGFITIGGMLDKLPTKVQMGLLFGEILLGVMTTLASGFAALDTALLKIAADNFANMIDSLTRGFEGIAKLKAATSGSLTTIKDIVGNLDAIYETLNSSNFLKPTLNEFGAPNDPISEAQKIAGFVKSFEETIKSLSEIETTLQELNVERDLTAASEKVSLITEKVVEIWNKLYGADMGGKLSEKSANSMSSVVTSISGIVTTIKNMTSTLNELEEVEVSIDNLTKEGGLIEKIVGIRNKLFEAFKITKYSGSYDVTDEAGQKYTGDFVGEYSYKQQATDLEHLADTFGHIRNVIQRVNQIYQEMISEGSVLALKEGEFAELFEPVKTTINEIAKWFSEEFGGKGTYGAADAFRDSDKLATDVSNLNQAILNFGELVDTIKAFSEKVKTLEGVGVDGDLTGNLGGLIEQIRALGEQITTGLIEGINFDGLQKSIESGISNITEMLQRKTATFKAKGTAAGRAYKEGIESQIKNINTTSQVNISVVQGIISGLGALANGVQQAVNNAVGNIHANAQVDVSGSSSSGRGLYSSRGGLVPSYYATGGSVFKRRGTDTIPAMLTPNEYVHRRSAVKMFGVDFMNKVNNLDVEGAMKSLYSRFGSHISNSTRSVVNNYNTINNNQKVTQNVSTNNPNFAFRRSSRFMGAI